jgi:hypothetical protein
VPSPSSEVPAGAAVPGEKAGMCRRFDRDDGNAFQSDEAGAERAEDRPRKAAGKRSEFERSLKCLKGAVASSMESRRARLKTAAREPSGLEHPSHGTLIIGCVRLPAGAAAPCSGGQIRAFTHILTRRRAMRSARLFRDGPLEEGNDTAEQHD